MRLQPAGLAASGHPLAPCRGDRDQTFAGALAMRLGPTLATIGALQISKKKTKQAVFRCALVENHVVGSKITILGANKTEPGDNAAYDDCLSSEDEASAPLTPCLRGLRQQTWLALAKAMLCSQQPHAEQACAALQQLHNALNKSLNGTVPSPAQVRRVSSAALPCCTCKALTTCVREHNIRHSDL